jgi:hypothetical protein
VERLFILSKDSVSYASVKSVFRLTVDPAKLLNASFILIRCDAEDMVRIIIRIINKMKARKSFF